MPPTWRLLATIAVLNDAPVLVQVNVIVPPKSTTVVTTPPEASGLDDTLWPALLKSNTPVPSGFGVSSTPAGAMAPA